MKKFGKDINDIFELKQSFIKNNDSLYENQKKIINVARNQILREKCKNCNHLLMSEVDFSKQKIEYKLCSNCGHLNGIYEDTKEFAYAVYVEDETNYYSKNLYHSETKKLWLDRVKSVYDPKSFFLKDIIISSLNKNDLIIDVGAGSGYFLQALRNSGFSNIQGYEVSEKQVKFANEMLGEQLVNLVELDNLEEVLLNTSAKVVSMIGVLEHLVNPRKILSAIEKNINIQYIYISIPLFSYSVFFEFLKEDMFHRQLAGGHTHLYSNESIGYFCEEFNLDIIGKWQFGADSMDLYRVLRLNLIEKNVSQKILEIFEDKFKEVMNSVQLILDQSEFSSEVHLVLKKRI